MSNLRNLNHISNVEEEKLLNESEYGDDDLSDINEEDEQVLLGEDNPNRDYDQNAQEDDEDELGDGDVLQLQINTDLGLDDDEEIHSETIENAPKRQEKFSQERNLNNDQIQNVNSDEKQTRNYQNTYNPQRYKRTNNNRNGQFKRPNLPRREEKRNRTVLINPRYQGSIEVTENNARLAWDNHIQPWATNIQPNPPLMQFNQQLLNEFVNNSNNYHQKTLVSTPSTYSQANVMFQPPMPQQTSPIIQQLQSPPTQFIEPQWNIYNGYNLYEQGPHMPENRYRNDLPSNSFNNHMNYPQQNYFGGNTVERRPFFEPPQPIPSLLDLKNLNSNFCNYSNNQFGNNRRPPFRNNNNRINKRINNQQQNFEPKNKLQKSIPNNNSEKKILVKPTTKPDQKVKEQQQQQQEQEEKVKDQQQQRKVKQQQQQKEKVKQETTDEETRVYLMKIEEQKRERERILKLKEERRLKTIQEEEEKKRKEMDMKTIPVVPITRPIIQNNITSNITKQTSFSNFTNRNVGNSVKANICNLIPEKNDSNINIKNNSGNLLTNRVVYIKTNQNLNRNVVTNSNSDVNNSNFFNNRKILSKDNLMNTKLVLLSNLSASTTESNLRNLSKGIGEIQKLNMDKDERQATILFKTVASAQLFFKTYQRHILDLSVIEAKLIPMI